ncbi:MAG: NAD(P)H-quinone oxidoreductase [Vicinamibacterales bacterium]
MRAIEISDFGGPEVLTLVERPAPSPRAGEVLIRVEAAGVNRPDVLQRQGRYPPPADASDLPGLEVSGTIAALGTGVTGWRMADRVCALVNGGGYAEYCVAPAGQCLPVPKPCSMVQAAGIPEAAFTVWSNVFERGTLSAGETFLVHGGSSGIGTMAIQLAKARGARVFTTAGSDDKCAACVILGAELAINYHAQDFVEAVKRATGGRGVNLILDMVGGDYLPRNLDALALDGRLVMIGRQRGGRPELDIMAVLRKRLTLTGSTLRARPVAEKGALARAVHDHVWPLFASGQLMVPVHATFPLDQASEAHRMMEASTHIGKLILLVQSPLQ